MTLRTLPLKGVYRTRTNSLVTDFYLPCLSESVQYDRAVGYFSSSMLVEAAFGLSGLIRNAGRMRLIIGDPLSDDEWEAVTNGKGMEYLQEQLRRDLVALLERAGSDRAVHSLELLSWMVATDSLEIRYAFKKHGMYHEKIGILTDKDGDKVVFHGSANESAAALLPTQNVESIAVYPSWRQDVFNDYGAPFVEGFTALWENETPDVLSVPVPSEIYGLLASYRRGRHSPPDLELERNLSALPLVPNVAIPTPRLPAAIGGQRYALREHQEAALNHWRANSYCGIFALATGSGKTVTALHAATRFSEQKERLVLVVAVPYQVLAEQWIDVMALFNMQPIRAFYSRDTWQLRLQESISAFIAGSIPFLSVIVVNDTLASPHFQKELAKIPGNRLMIVGDECHHHASRAWIDRVPPKARFKLGLSATPWNPGRVEHKNVLEQIYGPVVATYNLSDALREGVLCPYDYYWIPCSFDSEEAEEYENLCRRISTLSAQDPDRRDPAVQTRIQACAARRTRLLGALRSKGPALSGVLTRLGKVPHTLVYCGEGQHPLDVGPDQPIRLVDLTTQKMKETKWKVARITAEESAAERRRILESFNDGVIEAIAAIRVLDEGFDIPTCRTSLILASSNSYRQYVQRRGRVLRRAPGKEKATIYDFAAVPSLSLLKANQSVWRRQIESELVRIREFVQQSENSVAQQTLINKQMEELGLGAIYYEQAPVSEEDLYEN